MSGLMFLEVPGVRRSVLRSLSLSRLGSTRLAHFALNHRITMTPPVTLDLSGPTDLIKARIRAWIR